MDSLKPSIADPKVYPDSPIQAMAWAGCISWAAQEPDILKEFFAETGKHFGSHGAPVHPFEAMIDRACGIKEASAEEFVDWVNRNFWGEDPFTGLRYDGKTDEEVEAMMNGVDAGGDTP